MDISLFTRPNKPKYMDVTLRRDAPPIPTENDLAKPLEISGMTECHVTPSNICARMVDYLEADPEMMTLEPSAGTGNLISALIDSGHSEREIFAVEWSQDLYAHTQKRFKEVSIRRGCFLEYAEAVNYYAGEFPRIIMNPPFRKIKQHMNAAINLLADDGVLVALVPITYKHPDAIELETLDSNTFASAKVNTKIIRIER